MQGSNKKLNKSFTEIEKFATKVLSLLLNETKKVPPLDENIEELKILIQLLGEAQGQNYPNLNSINDFINVHFQSDLDLQKMLRDEFILTDWITKVNNYEVSLEQDNLLANAEIEKELYKGTDHKETNTQRNKFLYELHDVLKFLPETNERPRKTITMKEFLGEKGIELYKNAIEEEGKSRAFRAAVFLLSTEDYNGPKWDRKLILWVGGPSASGKTFGTQAAIKEAVRHMPIRKAYNNHHNYVVSIDGAIARQVSQMRQLVLQVALAKGYSGIKNLEKYGQKLNIKKYVNSAALAHKDISLVIPETFSKNPHFLDIRQYQQMDEKGTALHVFAQVVGDPQIDFQSTVFHMGNSRAWLSEKDSFSKGSIRINNRNIACESKAYGGGGFKPGVAASWAAQFFFTKINPKGIYLEITNDRMFVKRDENGNWRECKQEEVHECVLTRRAFAKWKKDKETIPLTQELPYWNDWYKSDLTLNGALITASKEDKKYKTKYDPISNTSYVQVIDHNINKKQSEQEIPLVSLGDDNSQFEEISSNEEKLLPTKMGKPGSFLPLYAISKEREKEQRRSLESKEEKDNSPSSSRKKEDKKGL